MRTKTLVLTALLGLAGSAAVMAQSVYSLNAVGYVNTTIPHGYSIIANPLNAATNKLSSLLVGAVENTVVFKLSTGGFTACTYAPDDNGNLSWDNDPSLVPGEGFYVYNPGTQFTNTFVGEVVTGTNLVNSIPVGYSLKSSIVPQAGALTDLGFVPSENDVVYILNTGGFTSCTYAPDDNGNLSWDNIPTVTVGQGFWVFTTVAKDWKRSFTLNSN